MYKFVNFWFYCDLSVYAKLNIDYNVVTKWLYTQNYYQKKL